MQQKITQELPVQNDLPNKNLNMGRHLIYFQHSTIIFNIQVLFSSFIFSVKHNVNNLKMNFSEQKPFFALNSYLIEINPSSNIPKKIQVCFFFKTQLFVSTIKYLHQHSILHLNIQDVLGH